MPEPVRLIKKYPNRRLYDTKTSAYITLSDVKELVNSFEPFRVLDTKTGNDLTRNILLQIIIEEEAAGVGPLLGTEFLTRLIRSYGHAMQGVLGSFLELDVKVFSDLQKKIQEPSPLLSNVESVQIQNEFLIQYMALHGQAMQSILAEGTNESKYKAMPTSASEQPVIERIHRES